MEALLHRERYRRLHQLLTSGRVEIRVVPKDRVFIHGKAGVIEAADGSKTCFLGSINETKRGFRDNYEILWEDRSAEGSPWVEEEFEALWKDGYPLPNAIADELSRPEARDPKVAAVHYFLINVDLTWNPSRLEQRLGRIKRFGQARRTVDMLNLVYHETQDEKIYQVLSRRMKDRFDLFGGLPDTIEDDWIESIEKLEEMMDEYIHLRQQARNVFEMRHQETIAPDKDRWELVHAYWPGGIL